MVEIITRDVTSSDLKEVVNKLLPDSIAKDIEKVCQGIYPLHDVYIRKVTNRSVMPWYVCFELCIFLSFLDTFITQQSVH
jgi:hypothetical protein